MPNVLLTIDDSPSPETDQLTDLLMNKNIPAILFCRGDHLEKNPDPIVRAVEKGFVIANHAYSHCRASTVSYKDMIDEIEKTEVLIDDIYQRARQKRPKKYFRFPHMDRGAGGWIIDYNAVPEHRDVLVTLFSDGLNIDLMPPSPEQIEKKDRLQSYLQNQGFVSLSNDNINYPWFTETEMTHAIDAMFTFSTSDWMVTPRHAGQWPYKNTNDLIQKIDRDPWLADKESDDIILMHDQGGLFEITAMLLQHFLDRGFAFKEGV